MVCVCPVAMTYPVRAVRIGFDEEQQNGCASG